MKLTVNTCYSHILYILLAGPKFSNSVSKFRIIDGPHHQYEGAAGFIETEVEFDIKDLELFAKLWYEYCHLVDEDRMRLRQLAMGIKVCK